MGNLKYFLFLFLPFTGTSQSGEYCDSAITLFPEPDYTYTSFTSNSSSMWFKFVATSENIQITLLTGSYGSNVPHIHNVAVYQGTCSGNVLIISDELPFVDSADALSVDLIAYGLITGQTYYLKADRIAHTGACDKSNCTNNESADPATFYLRVKEINLIVPPEFGSQLPAKSYAYEENRGQLADFDHNPVPEIKFFSRNTIPQMYIADQFASFVWSSIDTISTTVDTVQRIDMFLQKSAIPTVYKSEQLAGYNNYYISHIPNGVLNNTSFSRVMLNNVYPLIDMHYYSSENGRKMYFIVKEGGDASQIKIEFSGATSTNATPLGGLAINSVLGSITFSKAVVYGIDHLGNYSILSSSGAFVPEGGDVYSIAIESYNENLNLFIVVDQEPEPPFLTGPEDLEWSTYFGGVFGGSKAADLDSDSAGNIYVVGGTTSAAFPMSGTGVFDDSINGYVDGFLAKFSNEYELKWTTYFGGSRQDEGTGIAHDNLNNVTYISGGTDNFGEVIPYTAQAYSANPNAYVDTYNPSGYSDDFDRSFVSRFDAQGAREWSTFLINGVDEGLACKVAVDNEGNLYAAGTANMPDGQVGVYSNVPQSAGNHPICFPASNSYRQFFNGGGGGAGGDTYIVKFNNDLELVWSTFLGGDDGADRFSDLAIDNTLGLLYIVGSESSSSGSATCPSLNSTVDFPLCDAGGFFQDTQSPSYISRFNLDGELNWSTYFDGTVWDVDVNQINGNFYVTGTVLNVYGANLCGANIDGGFPKCDAGGASFFQASPGGSTDVFIAGFRYTTPLVWSTFIGGSGEDGGGFHTLGGPKVNVNTNGNIHLFGTTKSRATNATTTFPTASNPNYYFKGTHVDYPAANYDRTDTYVMSFSPSRELQWSTYFGGIGSSLGDRNGGILGLNDRVYICGMTNSATNFPYHCPNTTTSYCQPTLAAGTDAFIAQLRVQGTEILSIDKQQYEVANADDITVYPNPNNGDFILQWNSLENENTEIRIMNYLGQQVQLFVLESTQGINQKEISTFEISSGIYFITVNYGTISKMAKVVIR